MRVNPATDGKGGILAAQTRGDRNVAAPNSKPHFPIARLTNQRKYPAP